VNSSFVNFLLFTQKSVQGNLAEGRIIDLSSLMAANGFARCWPPFNTWFLGNTRVSPKWHLDQFSRFYTAHQCVPHTYRPTSVAIGHILCIAYRQCGLIIINNCSQSLFFYYFTLYYLLCYLNLVWELAAA